MMARPTMSQEVCTNLDLTSVHLVMFSLFWMMWPARPDERASRSAVLLCFIKPILGNRDVRSRGFIVSESRETHP